MGTRISQPIPSMLCDCRKYDERCNMTETESEPIRSLDDFVGILGLNWIIRQVGGVQAGDLGKDPSEKFDFTYRSRRYMSIQDINTLPDDSNRFYGHSVVLLHMLHPVIFLQETGLFNSYIDEPERVTHYRNISLLKEDPLGYAVIAYIASKGLSDAKNEDYIHRARLASGSNREIYTEKVKQ